VDFDLCTRRISRHLEREHTGRFRSRGNRIVIAGKFLVELKKKFGGGMMSQQK